MVFKPHPGPQSAAAKSDADILIFGGEAGGGKSFLLLAEAARFVGVPGYAGVIFRRKGTEIRGGGGLWEESQDLYPDLLGEPNEDQLRWRFPAGSMVEMRHLEYEKNKYDHKGKQYAYVGFDELTSFTEGQFWYLYGRMRTKCGVTPYMRATTNPDKNSWVRNLVDWWIGSDGLAIKERCGVLRWFIRDQGELVWADSKRELQRLFPSRSEHDIKSLTFVHAGLEDNPTITENDPGYAGRLEAQTYVERMRLRGGNWDIEDGGGEYIKREWLDRAAYNDPPEHMHIYIATDFAATAAEDGNDPDYTEFGVFGYGSDNRLYALDWWWGQTDSGVWVEELFRLVQKWKPLRVFYEKGPILNTVRGVIARKKREEGIYFTSEDVASTRDKHARGLGLQAMASNGDVCFPRNAWGDRCRARISAFPVGKKDTFDVASQMCGLVAQAHPGVTPKAKADATDGYRRNKKGGAGNSWRIV